MTKKNPSQWEGLKISSNPDYFQFLATTSARSTTLWL